MFISYCYTCIRHSWGEPVSERAPHKRVSMRAVFILWYVRHPHAASYTQYYNIYKAAYAYNVLGRKSLRGQKQLRHCALISDYPNIPLVVSNLSNEFRTNYIAIDSNESQTNYVAIVIHGHQIDGE